MGGPPTALEIFAHLNRGSSLPINNAYEVAAILATLHREEMVFVDKNFVRWTVRKKDGYMTFSELFLMRYGEGYGCSPTGGIIATTARTVKYSTLVELLKSRDAAALEANQWIWEGN